jgi:cysteine desulfurase/selenocysteine lyase
MTAVTATGTFNVETLRKQFPILNRQVNGRRLVYLDNAATSQKPQRVIEALHSYYTNYNANIHRGIHTLAEEATRAFEETRSLAKTFLGARHSEEIIFTRGVTEGINLVAASFGRAFVKAHDEIVISGLEHHSNIVPWQMMCEERGAHLKVIPVFENGTLDLEAYRAMLNTRTRLVAVNHASNSLGTVNPVSDICSAAHEVGAAVLIDGAQAAPHFDIDVATLDCDFYAVSSHKMYGPTGIGVLYGKQKWLEGMPPYMGGGEMIREVTFAKTTYNELPYKFEAGTPNIADGIAFGEAIRFVSGLGRESTAEHEQKLLSYATRKLSEIPGLKIIGTAPEKVSVVSFVVDGIHPFDIGQMLDSRGIAVRTGHHCTQPLMDRFGIEGTVRASFAVYNTMEEVDALVEGVQRAVNFLKK